MCTLRFCSCRMCKAGRHSHRDDIKKIRRASRRRTKRLLKEWRFDELETHVSVPYTD